MPLVCARFYASLTPTCTVQTPKERQVYVALSSFQTAPLRIAECVTPDVAIPQALKIGPTSDCGLADDFMNMWITINFTSLRNFEASTRVGQESNPHHLSALTFRPHLLGALLGLRLHQVQLGTFSLNIPIQNLLCNSAGEDAEKLEPLCTADGMYNGAVVMENGWAVPQRAKQNYHMTQQLCS
ncbi:hypothetical protein mRhiFer1_008610 [Rhinolophus ferrumequinum]|uniref:Uncharacterized protein n=1 Tax=Rhinolophus ferrumequinum TaxID=59479 RepID=A0A7J7U0Z8_RHIFE|nr:hypothetical protein mRhiFer1_008610 [Rhinolophus ferrumequinum]